MESALQILVWQRARHRCEYCLLPEQLVTTPFQIDHIIAESHGGRTESDNLALACFYCNNFKGPNFAGMDPETNEVTRLFNPRQDDRVKHFRWHGARLTGITAIGRATVQTLRLNHPERVFVRRSLQEEGVVFAL
jgi:hypothetical protein